MNKIDYIQMVRYTELHKLYTGTIPRTRNQNKNRPTNASSAKYEKSKQ